MNIRLTVARNLNDLITRSGRKPATYAVLANIPLGSLTRKLNGKADFTVSEVAELCRLLETPVAKVFADRPEVRPCTVAACVEPTHEWANGEQFAPCRLERIEGSGFVIHGHLLDAGWTAWVDADDLADAHEGLEQARGLLASFEGMQARCDALNGARLERRTEPGEPEFAGVGGGL